MASSAYWQPPKSVSSSATTSSRRPSVLCGADTSKFRSMTHGHTTSPSRQIWPTALSAAKPLQPNSAARWWPRASNRRPHGQERTKRSSGRRRRWSNRTGNGSGSTLVTRFTGIAVNGTDERGPLCDLTIARSGRESLGHTTCSLW